MDKTVRVWDVGTGLPIAILRGHMQARRRLFAMIGDVVDCGPDSYWAERERERDARAARATLYAMSCCRSMGLPQRPTVYTFPGRLSATCPLPYIVDTHELQAAAGA